MKRRTLLVLPVCAAALLSISILKAQIKAPKAGIVRYLDGTVHAVYGLPANYIVDPQVLASADAVSFSDEGGITAKEGRILLLDSSFKTLAEYDSGEAVPLLNIDGDLTTAAAWLPSRQALLSWNGSSFVTTEVSGVGGLGTVSSVWLASSRIAKLLIANSTGSVSEATLSLDSGELISLEALPGVRGTAFRQQSFIVSRDAAGLAIASRTSVVRTFPLPAPGLVFERMSSDAVHVLSPGTNQNWVLHLGKASAPQLLQLPAISPAFSAKEVQK